MNSGYAERNMLGVTRMRYTGAKAPVTHKKHTAAGKTEKNITAPKTVSDCAGVKEKYRVSAPGAKMVRTTSVRTSAAEEKVGGFVYVEHCGVAGTLKDAFCTKRVKADEKSCFDKVVLILMFAVLMFFVAGSYCEYYETFRTSKEIQSQISQCREEQSKLLVAIEERNSEINIEEYAVNNLGMVKNEKLTKHYINISEKDVVNITVNEKDDDASGGVLLSGFKNVIDNFKGGN